MKKFNKRAECSKLKRENARLRSQLREERELFREISDFDKRVIAELRERMRRESESKESLLDKSLAALNSCAKSLKYHAELERAFYENHEKS